MWSLLRRFKDIHERHFGKDCDDSVCMVERGVQ